MTLAELFHLLRKHMRLVIALPVALAVLVAIVSFFMPDQYTASTTMYVLSRAEEGQQATNMATDLNASQMLTNDVAKILKSDRVSRDVADQLGLRDLGDYDISVDNTSTTRVVTLSVTGTDPVMTAQVANAFVTDVSSVAQEVMNVQSVNVARCTRRSASWPASSLPSPLWWRRTRSTPASATPRKWRSLSACPWLATSRSLPTSANQAPSRCQPSANVVPHSTKHKERPARGLERIFTCPATKAHTRRWSSRISTCRTPPRRCSPTSAS